jgi:serine/threonine-protein kinase HipA
MVDDAGKTVLINLWGELVGAAAWDESRGYAAFEFEPAFLKAGLDIAPLMMPLKEVAPGEVFQFPTLSRDTFHGLPGLLADALPDKFGNAIIDAWLARQGRSAGSVSPIERLCYTGTRGMGALEFAPPLVTGMEVSVPVEIAELALLAQEVTSARGKFHTALGTDERRNNDAMLDILRVGTSAGGARAKAIIAMNAEGKVLSGQTTPPPGYEHWLLKFDGVSDLELGQTRGYGRIEYAYSLMATAAGIEMSECRLLEENGRAHFMTRRFDRPNGDKLHMQSLCGIAHYDFNMAGVYGYEQAFEVMRRLQLTKAEALQLYRRMVFNVLARNQDDHTKNIAFLMGRDGVWRLSPAFDVIYAHNPHGQWTNRHQMTINGKRDHFTVADLLKVGRSISVPKPAETIEEIREVITRWPQFAREAGVEERTIEDIGENHRLDLPEE